MKRSWPSAVALALLGWLLLSRPAGAESLVINAGAPGGAGWQVQADQVSPARAVTIAPANPAIAAPVPYTVQPGDTLSAIAQKLGVDQAVLAAANGLTRPDQLQAGQRLSVGSQPNALVTRAPARLPDLTSSSRLAHLQASPWPPVQGQTVTLWWRTVSAFTATLQLGGVPVPIAASGRQGWAMLPVDSLAPTRTLPLSLFDRGVPAVTLPFPITAGVFESGDVPPDTADPILSQAAKVQAEAARMAELFARESAFGWTPADRFVRPLPIEGEHTSPFGTRRIYGSGTSITVHAGEDYAVPAGTPVLAPASGVVVLAEPLFVRGNAVVIDHGHGVLTGYWHMQVLKVKAGDRVEVGQELGEVGTTGLSTGPHLHWELHIHGVAVDPLQWLSQQPRNP